MTNKKIIKLPPSATILHVGYLKKQVGTYIEYD